MSLLGLGGPWISAQRENERAIDPWGGAAGIADGVDVANGFARLLTG